MRSLTYVSQSLLDGDLQQFAEIKRQSTINNTLREITGALYHDDVMFYQVIEGDPATITRLVEKLEKDDRHTDMHILEDRTIDARRFGAWSMKFVVSFQQSAEGPGLSYHDVLFGGRAIHESLREYLRRA